MTKYIYPQYGSTKETWCTSESQSAPAYFCRYLWRFLAAQIFLLVPHFVKFHFQYERTLALEKYFGLGYRSVASTNARY